MVCLKYLNVIAAVQQARGHVQQLQGGVDANTHVRCKDNGGLLAGRADGLLAGGIEAGGADHAFDVVPNAGLQVRQRALGAGEVEQAVGIGQSVQIVSDQYSGRAPTGRTRILANGLVSSTVPLRRKLPVLVLEPSLTNHPSQSSPP